VIILRKLKDVRQSVLEQDFKIIYINNKLDVVNYTDISHFDSNKIMVNYNKGSLAVLGNNLFVSKLLSDELLIEGNIEKIEFR